MRIEKLAHIAEIEAAHRYTANMPANAGPEVEKYLTPFRQALNQNAGVDRYDDLAVGYSWCGAFTHWCCREAGINLPLQPDGHAHTFALVRTWREWAQAGHAQWLPSTAHPLRGDLVVYRNLSEPYRDDCHIGVLVGSSPCGKTLASAEGNVVFGENGEGRRTQIKLRPLDDKVMGYIRLQLGEA